MCGIAGCFGAVEFQKVETMLARLEHRGPDGVGLWAGSADTLGHRRLAVQDTSECAAQPMLSEGGRFCVTFNGEIYNFKELRAQLSSRSYTFRSESDTEVLLAAYDVWGPECVHRFEGMFAFALVDRDPPRGWPQRLLVRDRFGIKPLLYVEDGKRLWFASELVALRTAFEHSKNINPNALTQFAMYGSVQQPETILSGVKSLPPGSMLLLNGTGSSLHQWWDLHTASSSTRSSIRKSPPQEQLERFRGEALRAAKTHLISDVSVGAFLSGGIDSAAVVGLMRAAGAQQINTYSIGFETPKGIPDERSWARVSAAFFKTDHHELLLTDKDAALYFDEVVRRTDQPSADGANTLIAARFARHGVTVALSGLGVDELMAGYPHFHEAEKLSTPVARTALSFLHRVYPHWRARAMFVSSLPPDQRLCFVREHQAKNKLPSLLRRRWMQNARHDLGLKISPFDGDIVQRISRTEVEGYLLNTLLRDADAMTMAHGLELRPVFLHHPLAELMYSLPAHTKVRDGRGKKFVVEALGSVLPPHIGQRRKRGFEMPLTRWMAQPSLQERITGLLNSDNAVQIFTRPYRAKLTARMKSQRPLLDTWKWAVMLGWMEAQSIRL